MVTKRVNSAAEETAQAEKVYHLRGLPPPGAKSPERAELLTAATRSCAAAAEQAADVYAPDEIEQHARAIIDAWTAKLKVHTDAFTRGAMELVRGNGRPQSELATSIAASAPPYPYWDVLTVGPFQPIAPGGPFLPHKIFQATEPAFIIGAVWLNPAGVGWIVGPSAATLMSAYNMTIRCETVNLTNVTNGPSPAPVVMAPIAGWPGPAWLKPFFMVLGPGVFPPPPQGQPHLYEMNLVADVTGPVGGLPFAGYSTWLFDPDVEPPIFPPPILPGVAAGWQYDIPARFLVYTA